MNSRENRVVAVAMICIAIGALIVFLSTRLPFFPSQSSQMFFDRILPLILMSLGFVLFARKRGKESAFRQAYNGENIILSGGWRGVAGLLVALVVISFLFPWILMPVVAGPSYLFARDRFEIVGVVTHSLPYSTLYRDFNNLAFDVPAPLSNIGFLWPTDKSRDVKPGACVLITGRSWFLGSYVEAIQAVPCR
jgi:hypothetical protein